MNNSLYKKLKELVDRQWEIKRVGGYIKHDKTKRAEFEKLLEEYNKNDETIEQIRRNCFISPLVLEKIISKQEDQEYPPCKLYPLLQMLC